MRDWMGLALGSAGARLPLGNLFTTQWENYRRPQLWLHALRGIRSCTVAGSAGYAASIQTLYIYIAIISYMMIVLIVFWFALNDFNWNVFCLAEEGMISCHTCFAKQFDWLRKYKFEWYYWLGAGPFAHTNWSQMICIEWFQLKWIFVWLRKAW